MKRLLVLAIALLTALPAWAAGPPFTFDLVHATWTVAADGSAVVESEVSIRIGKDASISIAEIPLTWSASVERLEVIQAQIEKKDGRIMPVPPLAIREDPLKGDQYFHEYSDQRRLVITVRDPEPGDRVAIRTRREIFRSRVPGGFMTAPVQSPTVGWEETSYSFSLPAGLPVRFETRGFEHIAEVIRDREFHHFRSPPARPTGPDQGILAPFDRLPRFAISTFPDWNAFAEGFAGLLMPHTVVTPELRALAVRITSGLLTPRDQAHALYDWVRDNVRGVAVPIDESAPDPHDAAAVMERRHGDSKDIAVLLYTLLAAKGIPAEFVLLNAADATTLAAAPNLRPMNHMILFLPGLDVYADATSGVAPFGVLRFRALGKPAIHIASKSPLRRIPIPGPQSTHTEMKTSARFDLDGTISGTTVTTARGAFGEWLRAAARNFSTGSPEAAVITLLRDHGTPGTGGLTYDPPGTPGEDYAIRGNIQIMNQSSLLRGGYFAPWTGLRILPRLGDFLGGPLWNRRLKATDTTFCYPGSQREELSLTLPEGRSLSSLPNDTDIDHDLVRFHSRWKLDHQTVTVTRTFVTTVPGPLCEGETRARMDAALTIIRADLNNQIGITIQPSPGKPSPGKPSPEVTEGMDSKSH